MDVMRGGGRRGHLLILVGAVIIALLLMWTASWWTARRIEQDLGSRTHAALAAAGIPVTVSFTGRDAVVGGEVSDSERRDVALTIVRGVWGVGSVASELRVMAAPAVPPSAAPPAAEAVPAAPAPSATPTVQPLWPQGSVGFASGSTTLSPSARAYLDSAARYLNQNPSLTVVIRGYADNVGRPDLNHALSRHRSDAVAAYLATHGVGTGRMRTMAFGDDQPVTSNDSQVGRSVNRRVELLFVEGN